MSQRSVPGQGKPVHIILASPEHDDRGCCDMDVLCGGIVEDFAVCCWPLVVKVDPTVSNDQLVTWLLWLASRISARQTEPMTE